MIFGAVSKRAGFILAMTLFVVGASWLAWFKSNNELQGQIALMEKRFEQMSAEHARAIEAANMALKIRDEIHEEALAKAVELENELRHCADFADMAIPEPLRLLLQNACARADFPATAAGPANGDKLAKP